MIKINGFFSKRNRRLLILVMVLLYTIIYLWSREKNEYVIYVREVKKNVTFIGKRSTNKFNGTCSSEAWKLGNHQKILSYSFFDKPDRSNFPYWRNFDQILNDASIFYPEFKVRVYATMKDILLLRSKITSRDFLFFCDVNHLPPPINELKVGVMVWRFVPMGDPQVDVMLVRDLDSMITQREVDAVREWISSNKTLHVMRDHPSHRKPIQGGMWGIKMNDSNRKKLQFLRNKILKLGIGKETYGDDQYLLQDILWPHYKYDNMGHDSYNCQIFSGSKPFPTQRTNGIFVAGRANVSGKLSKECPVECRPPQHLDWIYC